MPATPPAEGEVESFFVPADAGEHEGVTFTTGGTDDAAVMDDPCANDLTAPTVSITPPSPISVSASSTSTVLYLVFCRGRKWPAFVGLLRRKS